MKKIGLLVFLLAALMVTTIAAETTVSLKVSGPGVINDSTLKVGEKVSFDIYTSNDTLRTGFTLGFAIKSDDIKSIIHVADSGNGINSNGDVKAFNGWQDTSVWDLRGLFAVERDWDGELPELMGFGGISVKLGYKKEVEASKKISFEIIVPEAGTLVVDSSFFPPGGGWFFSSPKHIELLNSPKWDGPHTYTVKK